MSQRTVLSVSQLTRQLKDLVEESFPHVWVAGEITGFTRSQSGHCYLSLKDARAQIKAVLWQTTARKLPFAVKDGLQVLVRASLELYPPRGTYQLVIEELEPQGIGARELALRQLKEKLAAEGLFAPQRKRPIPPLPRGVAVVTSPAGAAIRDFLEILGRRFPGTAVLVVPVRVQGDGAGSEIAQALRFANLAAQSRPLDAIVLTRGGGSAEDLWAFNTEIVARAIAASPLPVISAVGHEIDVTVADLVADLRAATPSEAAERLVPEAAALVAALAKQQRRLLAALRGRAQTARARLNAVAMHRAFRRPFERLHDATRMLEDHSRRATRAITRQIERLRQRLASQAAHLESLSPLAVLGRGYSLTVREADGRLVRHADDVAPGERIVTRLLDSQLISRVEAAPKGASPEDKL